MLKSHTDASENLSLASLTQLMDEHDAVIAAVTKIAKQAHDGQYRRGTTPEGWPIPYIDHPMTVRARLARDGYGTLVQVLGLLHDVKEDCRQLWSLYETKLRAIPVSWPWFWDAVIHGCAALDHDKRVKDYMEYIEVLAQYPALCVVKAYDILSNISDGGTKPAKELLYLKALKIVLPKIHTL